MRKREAITLDLNGIAKGYGVDRLAQTLRKLGITAGLVGIDGEMRALGHWPGGREHGRCGRGADRTAALEIRSCACKMALSPPRATTGMA